MATMSNRFVTIESSVLTPPWLSSRFAHASWKLPDSLMPRFGHEERVTVTWWTEDGHVTMPKAVMAMLAKAAISLRDEIVQEIQEKNSDLHPELGDPWARDVPPGEGK